MRRSTGHNLTAHLDIIGNADQSADIISFSIKNKW